MSSHQSSRYAYDGEPDWMMYTREYVVPAVVFVALASYLVFRVLLPMRHIERPTRRSAAEVTTNAAAVVAENADGEARSTDTAAASAEESKKTN